MPSTSPNLGGRVVAETDKEIEGSRCRILVITLSLPTPEGPEIIIKPFPLHPIKIPEHKPNFGGATQNRTEE